MKEEVQKRVIIKNMAFAQKQNAGFIVTYCDYIKNQILNNISICDRVKSMLEEDKIFELHNVENKLLRL